MLNTLCYWAVIFIWSTTPLAITLGARELTPLEGLTWRVAIALAFGFLISRLLGSSTSLRWRQHWKIYSAASFSLFPNMVLVYIAAEYVPSGVIALFFGLSPFIMALLAIPILGEPSLTRRQWIALLLAFAGLLLIFGDDSLMSPEGFMGALLLVLANLLFSISALFIKRFSRGKSVHPLEQTNGAMIIALPFLTVSWALWDGISPPLMTPISMLSLIYLALIASLAGFMAYYQALKSLPVATVSLIPLIIPMVALAIGVTFAQETLSIRLLLGASMIIGGLVIHQNLISTWRPTRRVTN